MNNNNTMAYFLNQVLLITGLTSEADYLRSEGLRVLYWNCSSKQQLQLLSVIKEIPDNVIALTAAEKRFIFDVVHHQHQHHIVNDVLVDGYSASIVYRIATALSTEKRETLFNQPVEKIANMCMMLYQRVA